MTSLTREQREAGYKALLAEAKEKDIKNDDPKRKHLKAVMSELGRKDLYFLLINILGRKDIRHDWLYARCNEVQSNPNFMLDLWAREHRKSTIITYALTIQDIVNNPEITICIFSITRPIAKAFLSQIKKEFEDNEILKWLYSDVLFQEPKKESDSWSEDKGINVRRTTNPKEHTLEAFGFIEGLPTSRHYNIRVYDDAIDQDHVTNPEIIEKAVNAWELSLNLGSDQVLPKYGVANIERYIGTRYHYNDIYKTIEERKAGIPRIRSCTDNGKPDGKSVYFPEELLRNKLSKMGTYTAACQMFLDPKADSVMGFDKNDLRYWEPNDGHIEKMNLYMLVDPASKKNPTSDYTTILVIGLAEDQNYYLVDGIRDRLGLHERAVEVLKMHRTWFPKAVGYEEVGMQADIEHIEYVQKEENYNFDIIALPAIDAKTTRINGFVPTVEQHRYFLPVQLAFIDRDGKSQNLTVIHRNEIDEFPFGLHDDTIDCAAKIKEPMINAMFPKPVEMHELLRRENERSGKSDWNYDPLER